MVGSSFIVANAYAKLCREWQRAVPYGKYLQYKNFRHMFWCRRLVYKIAVK